MRCSMRSVLVAHPPPSAFHPAMLCPLLLAHRLPSLVAQALVLVASALP